MIAFKFRQSIACSAFVPAFFLCFAIAHAQDVAYDLVYGGLISQVQSDGDTVGFVYDADGFSPVRINYQESAAEIVYEYAPGGHRLVRMQTSGNGQSQLVDLGPARFQETGALEYFLPGNAYIYYDPDTAEVEDLTWITDRQGSVRGLLDQSQAVVQRIGYDVAGAVSDEAAKCGSDAVCASALDAFDLRREGLQYRESLALYDNKARFYDPVNQRFGHRDPAGVSISPYTSRRGDPVNYVDLNGEQSDFLYAFEATHRVLRPFVENNSSIASLISSFTDSQTETLNDADIYHINSRFFTPYDSLKSLAYEYFMKTSKAELLNINSGRRQHLFDEKFYPFLQFANVGEVSRVKLRHSDSIDRLEYTYAEDLGVKVRVNFRTDTVESILTISNHQYGRKELGRRMGVGEATEDHLTALAFYRLHLAMHRLGLGKSMDRMQLYVASLKHQGPQSEFVRFQEILFERDQTLTSAARAIPTARRIKALLGLTVRDNTDVDIPTTNSVKVSFRPPVSTNVNNTNNTNNTDNDNDVLMRGQSRYPVFDDID